MVNSPTDGCRAVAGAAYPDPAMTADRGLRAADLAVLLREWRRAAALTQADLAGRAGLAVRTVRDLERGRTARPRRATAELLAKALGLSGEDRARLLAAARGETGPPTPADARAADEVGGGVAGGDGRGVPLPPPVPLVGRQEELDRLADVVAAADAPVT